MRDLISSSGRIKIQILNQAVNDLTRKDFIAFADNVPFLIGSAIYEGNLKEFASEGRGIAAKTVAFSRNQLIEQMESDSIRRSVYPLLKGSLHRNASPAFQIGRLAGNDIIITDVSVSKKHATIVSFGTAGQIIDLGSTNGTAINGKKLKPKERVRIADGDLISLGRYEFKFLLPGSLYDLFKKG